MERRCPFQSGCPGQERSRGGERRGGRVPERRRPGEVPDRSRGFLRRGPGCSSGDSRLRATGRDGGVSQPGRRGVRNAGERAQDSSTRGGCSTPLIMKGEEEMAVGRRAHLLAALMMLALLVLAVVAPGSVAAQEKKPNLLDPSDPPPVPDRVSNGGLVP